MKNTVPLIEAAEINPPLPRNLVPKPGDSVAFVPMAQVGEDGSISSIESRPFSEVSKGYTQFCENDVLLAKITPCMENGKAALVRGLPSQVACGSTEFHVLRPRQGTCPRYLFHAVWNQPFRNVAAKNMTGSAGQKRVPRAFLESYRIPLPPLAEQKRIAAILDKADAIRRKLQQSLRLSDDFLRSVFLDMFGDPVTNPKGWKEMELQELGKISTGTTPPSKLENMFGGSIPFITPGDLKEGWISTKRTVTEQGAKQSRTVRKGATLVCCIGATIGKMGKATEVSAFNQQINAVEWNAQVDDSFGIEVLKFFKARIADQGTSTTLPILNKSAFQRLTIPVPPISNQSKFADIITSLERHATKLTSQLADADTLFSSLQQRAFRGEL